MKKNALLVTTMSKKSKGLIIIFIVFALVIVSMGYVVYSIIGVERVERRQSYEYNLHVIPDENGNYTLYVPILINEDESISELTEGLHITSGNATNEIIDTEHGWALKIEGEGEVVFESSTKEQISYPYLSMLNETIDRRETLGEVDFWIFCNRPNGSGNITLSVHLETQSERDWYNGLGMHKWSSGNTREEEIEEVTLTSGWQKVPGYISVEVSN
jgi:hypothetical protein